MPKLSATYDIKRCVLTARDDDTNGLLVFRTPPAWGFVNEGLNDEGFEVVGDWIDNGTDEFTAEIREIRKPSLRTRIERFVWRRRKY